MKSIGQILREERLQQGLALEQVSALTRISLKNLTAIEADDLSRFPSGGFFYKSFVHQYSDTLKLDFKNLSDALQSAAENIAEPAIPGSDGRIPPKVAPLVAREGSGYRWVYTMGLFLVVVAGCSGLYAWWKSSTVSEPEIPISDAVSATAPERSSQTQQLSAGQSPADAKTLSETDVQPGSSASDAEPPLANYGTAFQVRIAALEQTWLSMTSDGKQVFSGVMQPDETRVLEGHDRGKMKVGNAGGLAITFNGRQIGTLGPRGQVRTVVFTKDNFEVVHPRAGTEEVSLVPSANGSSVPNSVSSLQPLLLPLERE